MTLLKNYTLSIFLSVFSLFAIEGTVQAQNAAFDIETSSATNPAKICVGEAITFRDQSGSPGGNIFHYNNGTGMEEGLIGALNTSVTTAGPISFSTPGTYYFRHRVANNTTLVRNVQVVGTPVPSLTSRSCAGNQAFIDTDNLYDTYQINWGDATITTTGPSSTATHTYASAGTYYPSVIGKYTSTTNCQSAPVSFELHILNALVKPDVYALKVLNQASPNGSIELTVGLNASQKYVLREQQGGGGFTDKATLDYPTQTQYTFTGLSTGTDPYYYMLYAFDDCGNTIESDYIYSSGVVVVTPQNGQNLVQWEDYHDHPAINAPNFGSYEVYVNGSSVASGLTTNSYTHAGLDCGEVFTYQIVTHTTTGQIAVSDEITATATSTTSPTSVTDVNSTVQTNGTVRLEWTNAVGFVTNTFHIERSDNGGAFINRGGSSSNQFTDGGAATSGNQYCYQVSYTDLCNNNSAMSAITCPVYLQVTSEANVNTITWTAYTGYNATGVQSYELQMLDQNNNVISAINMGTSFSTTDEVDPSVNFMRYRIRVISNGTENLVSYSNIVEVNFEPQIHVPNAFTPNADGTNDVFLVKGQFYQNLQITIFNQWGEVIFSSSEADLGWDGVYNGEPAPVDDYAYIIKAQDNQGGEIIRKGTVSLLR